MADREDIIDIAVNYTWALDTKQLDLLRDVFTPDATGMLRGVACDGVDAIIERIGGAILRLDASQHLVGNHQVRVDGDTASSTVIECNEDDNAASGSETCPGLL